MPITWDNQVAGNALTGHWMNLLMYRWTGSFSANLATSTAFDYFNDTSVAGHYLLIGFSGQGSGYTRHCHNVIFNVGTPLTASSLTVAYEYSTGASSWAVLPDVIDTTNCFRTAGVGGLYFEIPDNAYAATINGTTQIWVRIRLVSVTGLTEGGANVTNVIKINTGNILVNQNASLANLYASDLAGTRELLCPLPAAMNMSLYGQPSPMEWGAIKLQVVVTNYSAPGSITITGTNAQDTPLTETVNVTGNGTLTTASAFKTVSAQGVDATGNYTLQLLQPRWGVIGKFGANLYVAQRCTIIIGDNTNPSAFTESGKSLYMRNAGINVAAQSSLTFGTASSGYAASAMTIVFEFAGSFRMWEYCFYAAPASTTYFYNTSIDMNVQCRFNMNSTGVIRACKVSGHYAILVYNAGLVLNQLQCVNAVNWSVQASAVGMTFTDLMQENCGSGVLAIQGGSTIDYTSPSLPRFVRLTSGGPSGSADLQLYAPTGMAAILVDPKFTPTPTRIKYYTNLAGQTFRVYIDYTCDIRCCDSGGVSIDGAAVSLFDKTGAMLWSATTSGGSITTKAVTAKVFEKVNTNTPGYTYFMSASDQYSNGPFTMVVRKPGYETYRKTFDVTERVNETIRLRRSLTPGRDDMGPEFRR